MNSRHSFRLGLAILGVLSATTMLAPITSASAAEMARDSHDYTGDTRMPDVKVAGSGINGGDSNYWTAAFEITNKYLPANNVTLQTFCSYNDRHTGQFKENVLGTDIHLSLPANQNMPITKTTV